MIKITVLGAGTVGCCTAMVMTNRFVATFDKGVSRVEAEIELVHDPNIQPAPVGLATQPAIMAEIWNTFNVDFYENPLGFTLKTGILYEGWGKRKEEFFHPFPTTVMAAHFSPDRLRKHILNSGMFNVREMHVENYDEIDSDYIIDCRGRPKETEMDKYDVLRNPLNSVLVNNNEMTDHMQHWTRSVATPNGWTFGVPTKDFMSFGYLYNDNLTTESDAVSNFTEMFGVDASENKKLKFSNYIAKNPVIDERVFLSGDKLFFIEPLEALSIDFSASIWNWLIFEYIMESQEGSQSTVTSDYISRKIRKLAKEAENFLLWHYQFGSKYDTSFWTYAETLKPEPIFYDFLESIRVDTPIDYFDGTDHDQNSLSILGYAPFSYKNWYGNCTI